MRSIALGIVILMFAACSSDPDPVCLVNGITFPNHAEDPGAPCMRCDTSKALNKLTRAADGATCPGGGRCVTGSCIQGCEIEGVSYSAQTVDPENACHYCIPAVSAATWTVAADGTGCGDVQACVSGVCTGGACLIDDVTYQAGAPNPANGCQSCNPATPRVWSNSQTGQSCGNQAYCTAGSCVTGCFVSGQVFAANAVNPIGNCASCQLAVSSTAWTPFADGLACTGGKCEAGICVRSCTVDGVAWASGATNPTNSCLTCQPTSSNTAWSPQPEGIDCAGGKCSGGQCIRGCVIDGKFYGVGSTDPVNSCAHCDPSQHATDWTAVASGAACPGSGNICLSGQCTTACYIDGTRHNPGDTNTANTCQKCNPTAQTGNWTTSANGVACGGNKVCNAGVCGP